MTREHIYTNIVNIFILALPKILSRIFFCEGDFFPQVIIYTVVYIVLFKSIRIRIAQTPKNRHENN